MPLEVRVEPLRLRRRRRGAARAPRRPTPATGTRSSSRENSASPEQELRGRPGAPAARGRDRPRTRARRCTATRGSPSRRTNLPPGRSFSRGELDEVDDVLRRQVLDHLDHHDPAETARFEPRAGTRRRGPDFDVETAAARGFDELRVGFDAADLTPSSASSSMNSPRPNPISTTAIQPMSSSARSRYRSATSSTSPRKCAVKRSSR